MRLLPLSIALLVAAPAFAQELGRRTRAPQQMLAADALSRGQEDIAEALAAAAAHPLGSLENPVRVGGPDGERAYLARLRCADGAAPQVGARTEAGIGAFGTRVSAYPVRCGGSQIQVAFDMYHEEHVEHGAPPGLVLAQ